MKILPLLFLQLLAFASGIVISGGVFSLIASIGVVPRFAIKTNTKSHIGLYENCIIAGGIFGSSTMIINYYIPIGNLGVILFSVATGVFVGSIAVSLAEILNVIPILTKRGRIAFGIPYFLLSVALGKFAGSLIYYVLPGFYHN